MNWWQEFVEYVLLRTADEVKKMASYLLQKIKDNGGSLGTELFNAIAGLTVGIALDCVILRKNPQTQKLEIYLTQRGPDEAYANQWHCPGTFMRPGENEKMALDRLGKNELQAVVHSFLFCDETFLPEERFKTFLDRVYLLNPEEEPANPNGQWVELLKLHDLNVIKHHMEFVIPAACQKAREINLFH